MDVLLANRSIKVLRRISMSFFVFTNPKKTYPQISFSLLYMILASDTFYALTALLGEMLAMSTIGFCQGEERLDSLLIYI